MKIAEQAEAWHRAWIPDRFDSQNVVRIDSVPGRIVVSNNAGTACAGFTASQVEDLIPLLQRFVDTGSIAES